MELLKLMLFVFLGGLIHLGFKFKQAYKKEDFNLKLFLKKNIVGSILGLITGLTLLLLKEDIALMFGITINNFTSLVVGYTGDSFWKQLIKKGKSELGIDKK